jgi:hypothetical protein
MSNQNYEISLLRLLSEYVTKKKPFDIGEIKGAIALYELSVAQLADEAPAISLANYADPFLAIQKSLFDDPTHESESDEIETTKSVEENTQKVSFTRWPQKFVDEVVNFSLDTITSRRHITQSALAELFLKKFYDRIPEDERTGDGRSRAKYIDKLHKNIYNNLIKPNQVEFYNDEYHLIKTVYVNN